MNYIMLKPPDYISAAACFERALSFDPLNHKYRQFLGEALFNIGGKRLEEAAEHFKSVAETLHPWRASKLYYRIGQCYFEHHRFEEAASWFTKVPSGHGLYEDAEKAAVQSELARTANEDNAPPDEMILRMIKLVSKEIDSIMAKPLATSDIGQKLAFLFVQRGCLHAKLIKPSNLVSGHLEDTLADYRAALEADKDFALAYYCEGLFWLCCPHLDRPDEYGETKGRGLIELALELDWSVGLQRGQYPFEPESEQRFLLISRMFESIDRTTNSEIYLDKSICAAKKVHAEDNQYMILAARHHPGGLTSTSGKRLYSALNCYLKLSELDRHRSNFSPRYFLRRGEVHELLGRFPQANADYTHALLRANAKDSTPPHGQFNRGEIRTCTEGQERTGGKPAFGATMRSINASLTTGHSIKASEVDGQHPQGVVFRSTLSGNAAGFFVSESGLILTCAHGMAAFGPVTVSYFEKSNDTKELTSIEVEAELLRMNHEHDLAILSIQVRNVPFRYFALAKRNAPIGTSTVSFGHPARKASKTEPNKGRSAFYQRSTGKIVATSEMSFNHDSLIAGGYSGGPVINSDTGEIVGVNLAHNVGDKVSIASSIAAIRKLLQS